MVQGAGSRMAGGSRHPHPGLANRTWGSRRLAQREHPLRLCLGGMRGALGPIHGPRGGQRGGHSATLRAPGSPRVAEAGEPRSTTRPAAPLPPALPTCPPPAGTCLWELAAPRRPLPAPDPGQGRDDPRPPAHPLQEEESVSQRRRRRHDAGHRPVPPTSGVGPITAPGEPLRPIARGGGSGARLP